MIIMKVQVGLQEKTLFTTATTTTTTTTARMA